MVRGVDVRPGVRAAAELPDVRYGAVGDREDRDERNARIALEEMHAGSDEHADVLNPCDDAAHTRMVGRFA
jgi:hypothetical protein